MSKSFPFHGFPSASCYIVPKPTATTKQLKKLGETIRSWVKDFDVSVKIEHGLEDLAVGELPTPKPIDWITSDENFKPLQHEMEELAKSTSYRGVFIKMYTVVNDARHLESLERNNIIGQLRETLPIKAVQEVLVDGVSWNE